jgi:hypothetical protein
MKPELDRVKKDVETIQKAMGLAPSLAREWIEWMKRDRWFSLWWCLPGLILISSALLPLDSAGKHFGLAPGQWAGLLVAAFMLGITAVHFRKTVANDGRPPAMIRECKRLNGMSGEGLWFSLALSVQVLLYFLWANHYHIAFEPFWSGLFIFMGATCLVASVSTKVWTLLGWAIPFLVYGLCLPLAEAHHKVNGVLFGMMFIAVALSLSIIQVCQIRQMERQHEPN